MTDPNSNNLNAGMRCIKVIILVISMMFGLTAFLLMAVGSTITNIFNELSIFVDDHFFTPANLMTIISVCLLIVAITGCIGAFKESTMLVNVFAVLLFIVFSMELTASLLAYMMHGQVEMMLLRTMNESLYLYNSNSHVEQVIDYIQSGFQCCGIDEPRDWEAILGVKDGEVVVPESCCAELVRNKSDDGYECAFFARQGCLPMLYDIITQSAMLIASGALTIAFVQFLGVICAFMLAKTIRRTKSIRETRRWQLQQSLGVLTNPFSFDKQVVEESSGRQYDPDPEYTQMGQKNVNTYSANSSSIM